VPERNTEFASPEQFAGVGVDIRSDLRALDVVLWKMVTGQTPFRGSPASTCGPALEQLLGCASAGETQEEARQNIEAAIGLYLAPTENRVNDWVCAVRLA
jgi:serine/threonine protein kinase